MWPLRSLLFIEALASNYQKMTERSFWVISMRAPGGRACLPHVRVASPQISGTRCLRLVVSSPNGAGTDKIRHPEGLRPSSNAKIAAFERSPKSSCFGPQSKQDTKTLLVSVLEWTKMDPPVSFVHWSQVTRPPERA